MILSRENIEEIAAAVTMDFNKFFFQDNDGEERTPAAHRLTNLHRSILD